MNDIIETRDITTDGITYRVKVTYDADTNPFDADCYDADDIAAWRRDDWCCVNVDVTPVIDGTEIDLAMASLSGTEYGTLGNGKSIDMDVICTSHPVPKLITEARDMLADTLPKMIVSMRETLGKL